MILDLTELLELQEVITPLHLVPSVGLDTYAFNPARVAVLLELQRHVVNHWNPNSA